jgi:hypothetical protein
VLALHYDWEMNEVKLSRCGFIEVWTVDGAGKCLVSGALAILYGVVTFFS